MLSFVRNPGLNLNKLSSKQSFMTAKTKPLLLHLSSHKRRKLELSSHEQTTTCIEIIGCYC